MDGFEPKQRPESSELGDYMGPLKFISLADVEAKMIQWFWHNRIPAGMFSMIVGDPGIGKSFLTMYITAQITTGNKWPDANNTIDTGSVLLFSDEESIEYAIKPRLESHKADCSKVFAYNSLELRPKRLDVFNIQKSLEHLESYLNHSPDCRLIIFDPITAYLGDVNANANAEVRAVLLGLQQLAQRRRITVLGVSHFSKKTDLAALHRILGSTGFAAAARSVWAVIPEKVESNSDQQPGRLFMPIKSNYSIDVKGLRFDIINGRVVFDDQPVDTDIDSAMHGGRVAAEKSRAQDWLRTRLNGDVVLASDIMEEGLKKGFTSPTLQRAATELGVKKERSKQHHNKSVWSLPHD